MSIPEVPRIASDAVIGRRRGDRRDGGNEETRLLVLRGNSASGKSSVAARLRDGFGRGPAPVGQDNLRRVVLPALDR